MMRNLSFMKQTIRSKINLKSYSQVHGNIVKLSENPSDNEIKIPVYDQNISIFFNKKENLSDLIQRIKGSHEKIEKVEVFESGNKVPISDGNKNIGELLTNPFEIKVNNYQNIKIFPSVNTIIEASSPLGNEDNTTNKVHILNNYNYFLFKSFGNKADRFTTKSEVDKKLNSLIKTYNELLKEYVKAEEIIDKRIESKTNLYINLGILFFIAHAILFYFLIYQWYGWDTIEPITYIVGNVYWIIGLLFFVAKKKKLDFSFFSSSSFRKNILKTQGKALRLQQVGKRIFTKRSQRHQKIPRSIK